MQKSQIFKCKKEQLNGQIHILKIDFPRSWDNPLEGELETLWRYRVGSYRLIASIHDYKFVVEVVKAG